MFLVLSTAGCTSPLTETRLTAAPGAAFTVTDQAGRVVEITAPVERIVSGYYISTSVCIALGLADRLTGIEARAAARPIYALAAPELLELPSVGSARDFNMEACIALAPELVILPRHSRDQADIMAGMGISAILVNPESYESLMDMIALIGASAEVPDRAGDLIAYMEATRAFIENTAAQLTDRPSVYMCGVGSYLRTATKDMYQTGLIKMSGGQSAAPDLPGNGWADISYEQLLAMNPDVMVIPPEAVYGRDDVINDPQLRSLSAVVNGRVYTMPGDFEAWDSPIPSSMLGALWLLHVLHPDAYSMEELRLNAASFYHEFYGIHIDTGLIGK